MGRRMGGADRSKRRGNVSSIARVALEVNLADHVRNAGNEPVDVRSHRSARQEEPEETAHNCVCGIQAALPDEDEDENAQECDGGDANGHCAPSNGRALLTGGVRQVGGRGAGLGSEPTRLVWRRAT